MSREMCACLTDGNKTFQYSCDAPSLKGRLGIAASAEVYGESAEQKLHTTLVRSTFASQSGKLAGSRDAFGCANDEKLTPLWRKAHAQVKTTKKKNAASDISDVPTGTCRDQ